MAEASISIPKSGLLYRAMVSFMEYAILGLLIVTIGTCTVSKGPNQCMKACKGEVAVWTPLSCECRR